MVIWRYSDGLVDYEQALAQMSQDVARVQSGGDEVIWCLEHPPIYTAGSSANFADLVSPDRFPVYKTGRGGQFTYHGPGQRVIYVMLDLGKRGKDVRVFVQKLEEWVIAVLGDFNITGEVRKGRVGVWVQNPNTKTEAKIAAIGIRLSKWVSFHGISINVDPDLEHFSGIVPCGISEHGVTSFANMGQMITMEELDIALKSRFEKLF